MVSEKSDAPLTPNVMRPSTPQLAAATCAIFFDGTKREKEMTVELNHTIIPARDKRASAKFLADILGLEAGPEWSHFVPVRTSNGVTLDYADATDFRRQHYAFLVSESEFDAALSRIKAAGIAFYADFNRAGRGQVNHLYGGRGLYFDDPDGHLLEIITRPYGPTPERWTEIIDTPATT
jgi:catechol 2,3-dioxygenase-like lactoylglutathione lyase family enzyme